MVASESSAWYPVSIVWLEILCTSIPEVQIGFDTRNSN
jgi:hypothetical protein